MNLVLVKFINYFMFKVAKNILQIGNHYTYRAVNKKPTYAVEYYTAEIDT